MKRILFGLAVSLTLPVTFAMAQDAQQAKPAEPAKADEAKKEAKKEPAADPAATKESPFTAEIEAGGRWISGVAGDFNTYRSVVNLQEGFRVNTVQMDYQKEGSRFADEMHFLANSWGDPYNTLRFTMDKYKVYRFTTHYSNMAYFNYLPSFANPGGTYAFNQRAYDTQVKNYMSELELLPQYWVSPYVIYERNSTDGLGITPLVLEGNEYPIRNLTDWNQVNYRGGVRGKFRKAFFNLEQAWTRFGDDQYTYINEINTGNRTFPFLGQQLRLTNANQYYNIRGTGPITRGSMSASPYNWLDIYGQVIYASPTTDVNYAQNAFGSIAARVPPYLFVGRSAGESFIGDARRPRSSGSFSLEARPNQRIRIREIFEADKSHVSGNGTYLLSYSPAPGTPDVTTQPPVWGRTEVSYFRQTVEALVDVAPKWTVRGGYRYEFGDSATNPSSTVGPIFGLEAGSLLRHVGLGGVTGRIGDKLTLNADIEASNGVKTYYRTGLQDYQKFRIQARYNLTASWLIQANYHDLNNENPAAGVEYDYRARQAGLSLQWLPKGGRVATIIADYAWSGIRSDINYIIPSLFQTAQSLYVDNAHTGTVMADIRTPGAYGPRFSVGGSFVQTGGSRPTKYYQPIARLTMPLAKKFQFFSEWRYYDMNQTLYPQETFRTHMIMTGLRFLIQ